MKWAIATMALVSERSEDRTDYDYLMGASGAAIRVQMSEGQLCPSSPHATGSRPSTATK